VGIHNGNEVSSLVSIADEAKHISPAFTPSGVLDQGIDELLNVLEREPTIDFARWMSLYSMDLSQSYALRRAHLVSLNQGPTWARLVFRNPWSLNIIRTPSAMAAFAFSKLCARLAASTPPPQRDVIQEFIEASQNYPDTLDTTGITDLFMSMISGAGDTTATAIVAAIYLLLERPPAQEP
jgi:cytochrome P450